MVEKLNGRNCCPSKADCVRVGRQAINVKEGYNNVPKGQRINVMLGSFHMPVLVDGIDLSYICATTGSSIEA